MNMNYQLLALKYNKTVNRSFELDKVLSCDPVLALYFDSPKEYFITM